MHPKFVFLIFTVIDSTHDYHKKKKKALKKTNVATFAYDTELIEILETK